jgi:hypothetical protein
LEDFVVVEAEGACLGHITRGVLREDGGRVDGTGTAGGHPGAAAATGDDVSGLF